MKNKALLFAIAVFCIMISSSGCVSLGKCLSDKEYKYSKWVCEDPNMYITVTDGSNKKDYTGELTIGETVYPIFVYENFGRGIAFCIGENRDSPGDSFLSGSKRFSGDRLTIEVYSASEEYFPDGLDKVVFIRERINSEIDSE